MYMSTAKTNNVASEGSQGSFDKRRKEVQGREQTAGTLRNSPTDRPRFVFRFVVDLLGTRTVFDGLEYLIARAQHAFKAILRIAWYPWAKTDRNACLLIVITLL